MTHVAPRRASLHARTTPDNSPISRPLRSSQKTTTSSANARHATASLLRSPNLAQLLPRTHSWPHSTLSRRWRRALLHVYLRVSTSPPSYGLLSPARAFMRECAFDRPFHAPQARHSGSARMEVEICATPSSDLASATDLRCSACWSTVNLIASAAALDRR